MCIKSIIKITAHPAKICEENDETFNHFLLHTEGRCLSIGDGLQRLVDLYDSSEEFLECGSINM